MPVEITISNDVLYKGNWLHIHIPSAKQQVTEATLQNQEGTVIKRVKLHEGHNMIDVSQVKEPVVHLKIDTAFETICKEIKLNPL
ncbi:MAG: hypothetical protein JNM68_02640 [Dinghuibacter sp.]|nr:hypothetical protein [Dinghuibacter sp.]